MAEVLKQIMPPKLALLLTYGFVFWLFRRDIRSKPPISGWVWLPVTWFLIIATRNPTQWLAIWGVPGFGQSMQAGSNLDAIVLCVLMFLGLCCLHSRRVSLSYFVKDNTWLVLLLLYSLLAVAWSDTPYTSLKQWIRIMGHPIMAMIILTDPVPRQALRSLILRCSYIILPFSITLIKYFPHIGRRGGAWVQQLSDCGVTTDKNLLGANCWILGAFLVWFIIEDLWTEKSKQRTQSLYLLIGLLAMCFWCLHRTDSATSSVALVVFGLAIWLFTRKWFNRRYIGFCSIAAITIAYSFERIFKISSWINELRGKADTVEGRRRLQEYVLEIVGNPFFGEGYEAFWNSRRVAELWNWPELAWRPNQAHNGYIEMYLNLGLVGLVLLGGMLIETYFKSRREISANVRFGYFRMACLIAICAYNYTEATFRGLSLVYFVLFIISITYPRRTRSSCPA